MVFSSCRSTFTGFQRGIQRDILAELTRDDRSGLLPQLHEALVASGLKFRASANSKTLLYYVLDRARKQIGLAAFRVPGATHFSFPREYWSRHFEEVNAALSGISTYRIIESEGTDPSSRNSMRQVAVSSETAEHLAIVIRSLITTHVRAVSGHAA